MPHLLFDPHRHPEVTFDDVFLVPNNTAQQERFPHEPNADTVMREHCFPHEAGISAWARVRREVLARAEQAGYDEVLSRESVDFQPNGSLATTPVIVSNMNNVTGKRMAEAVARVGGIAAIPQDKEDAEIARIHEYLRTRHPVYETPVTVHPETKVHEFRRLLAKRSHDTAVVTNAAGEFTGVLSEKDIPDGINEDASVGPFLRREDVVTARDGITPLEASGIMEQYHVHYLPVLGEGGVVGTLTKDDAAMRKQYRSNIDPKLGGLRAIYTVGALNRNPLDRVRYLMDLGIRDILFDTAHFDQGFRPYINVQKAADLAAQRSITINLIAGNVVTRTAVRDILAAGAQYVKVGIGPGAMCETRMKTGVGRPQISAILQCAEEAHRHGGYVIADGGIRWPRDVALALAAGADYVMIGSLFAGTYESPPDLQYDECGAYKINYGMASTRASVLRTFGRAQRSEKDIFRDIVGHRSEGIDHGKVYVKPGRESVARLHHTLLDGVASACTYEGAASVRELPAKAIIGLQTASGFREGESKSVL